MQKKTWLLTCLATIVLTACSSYDDQTSGPDRLYIFEKLAKMGIHLPKVDEEFIIPDAPQGSSIAIAEPSDAVDIRPPLLPMPIIRESYAQFNGEYASIVYPLREKIFYNIENVERVFSSRGMELTKIKENEYETGWLASPRANDGDQNVAIRYRIETLENNEAYALVVSVLQAKRDDIVFTPLMYEKQVYTSGLLNDVVTQIAFNNPQSLDVPELIAPIGNGKIENVDDIDNGNRQTIESTLSLVIPSTVGVDNNGRTALIIHTDFNTAWNKTALVLPNLGFHIDTENFSRGSRLLQYKPLSPAEQEFLGISDFGLASDDYHMQLGIVNKGIAFVLSDEKGFRLDDSQLIPFYKALKNQLVPSK